MDSNSSNNEGNVIATVESSHGRSPLPPNPLSDSGLVAQTPSPGNRNDDDEVCNMSPEAAMDLVCKAIDALAALTGDVPPTPPVHLAMTVREGEASCSGRESGVASEITATSPRPSTPASAVSPPDIASPTFQHVAIGSPEMRMRTPYFKSDVGAGARSAAVQQQTIARKFYSKKPPPISLHEYMNRLQRYCPMSTAVYLAAGTYLHKLCVEDKLVPVTTRTRHRLVLASLRVAMKTLEDLRYPQQRFAGVGGVSERELKMLEITLCYLADFELFMDEERLGRGMRALRQVGIQGDRMTLVPDRFQIRLPTRSEVAG